MTGPDRTGSPACRLKPAVAWSLAAMLGLLTLTGQAAQSSSPFRVVVNPRAAVEDVEGCTLVRASGSTVSIFCDNLRFITRPPTDDQPQETGVGLGKARAVVCWRKVSQKQGDYFEMMLRW